MGKCVCSRLLCDGGVSYVMLVFMFCSVIVSGLELMFIVYLVLLSVVCFLSLGLCVCIVSLCSWCDGCCYSRKVMDLVVPGLEPRTVRLPGECSTN